MVDKSSTCTPSSSIEDRPLEQRRVAQRAEFVVWLKLCMKLWCWVFLFLTDTATINALSCSKGRLYNSNSVYLH